MSTLFFASLNSSSSTPPTPSSPSSTPTPSIFAASPALSFPPPTFAFCPSQMAPHGPSTFFTLLENVKQQQGLLEDIILASISTPSPITCIISDSLFPWTHDMASRLHIKRLIFSTTSATDMYVQQLFATQRTVFAESGAVVEVIENDEDDDPMLSLAHKEIAPQYIASSNEQYLQLVKEMYGRIENAADCIVVPTLHCLEGPILKAMPLSIPVRCCASFSTIMSNAEKESIGEEQSMCVEWLDKQKESSVLYISFGTVAQLQAEQMEELALGIEASRQPFLWVVRHDKRRDVRTKEAVEALTGGGGERGMVIEWAPQKRILSHPAVGGFLTHCGWNSTLESITMGVPMLCWPMFADQPLNSELIQKVWKVGMPLGNGKNDVVRREEVAQMAVSLLQAEEGRTLRNRARDLAQKVRNEKAQIQEIMEDVSK